MSASAIAPVRRIDQEAGGAEHAIEIGPIDETRSSSRPSVPSAGADVMPWNAKRTFADSTRDHVAVARSTAPLQIDRR